MPNPTVQAAISNGASVAGTTGVSITHGFTLANGDVLYAVCAWTNDGATFSSSGFPLIGSSSTTLGNDRTVGVLRKVITDAGSEPASYTFVNDSASTLNFGVILHQVKNADTTTPEDATTVFELHDNDFTPDSVDITTNTTGALVIAGHVACMDGGTGSKTGGAPSGFTLQDTEEQLGVASFELFIETASLSGTTAGAQTIGVWTGTPDDATSEGTTLAIAVKPSAAGGISIPAIDTSTVTEFQAVNVKLQPKKFNFQALQKRWKRKRGLLVPAWV